MHRQPLVSILMSVYNCEQWIEETLRSCFNQTWKNIEIIVVDDGSMDKTVEKIKQFEPKKSQRLRLIRQDHRGACAGRNRAINAARGDYFQFLDGDDLLHEQKIEDQIRTLSSESEPLSIVSCKWRRFSSNLEYTVPEKNQVLYKDLLPVDWLITAWESPAMMPPHAWLVPRLIINKAGYWDERILLNQDGEFFCRVILHCRKVLFCPQAEVFYRSHIPSSISAQRGPEELASLYEALMSNVKSLLNYENSERTRRACATLLYDYLISTYPELNHVCEVVEQTIYDLGQRNIRIVGSDFFRFLCKCMGWKMARRLQVFCHGLHIYNPFRLKTSIVPKAYLRR